MTLDLLARSSAILLAAWLMTRLLPRATAATRHLVWHLSLVAVLAAPLLAPVVPRFTVAGAEPLLDALGATTVTPSAPSVADLPIATAAAASSPTVGTTATGPTTGVLDTSMLMALARQAGVDVLPTCAALGTLALSLWFLAGWILTGTTVRRASPAPDAWNRELNALCAKLRIDGSVTLRIMAHEGSPLAAGVRRPAILLPPAALAWSTERRRVVLLHELAHIRRRDCRAQLLAQAACAVYWFNPLVWMAASRLRAERERACDDEVLQSGTLASSYAGHLLAIAGDLRRVLHPTAALAMSRPSDLEGRLLAVLAERRRTPLHATRWTVSAAMASVTIVLLGASLTALPSAATPPPARGTSPWLLAGDEATGNRAEKARRRDEAVQTLGASPDPEARRQAAGDLARRSPRSAIEPLRRALQDPDSDVRERSALALAFMSGPDVVPALLEALAHDDAQVREKAAIGLALRRDARVVDPLIAAMRDPDSQVREKVAIALGTSGDPRARDVLTAALRDPDSQVREKAAAALVLLGLSPG